MLIGRFCQSGHAPPRKGGFRERNSRGPTRALWDLCGSSRPQLTRGFGPAASPQPGERHHTAPFHWKKGAYANNPEFQAPHW